MSKQVQVPGAGMIALGVFIVAFVLLMLIGYSFLAALFFAVAVAAAVAIFFLIAQDRAEERDRKASATRSSAATGTRSATAPLVSSTPPVPETPPSSEPSPALEPAAAPAAAEEPSAERSEPERLGAPREGGADDLKRIKGIGPKIEDALNAAGIYHLDQIASWRPAEVAWMDEHLEDLRGRATRDDWVGQARRLTSGKETEFSRRADEGDVYD